MTHRFASIFSTALLASALALPALAQGAAPAPPAPPAAPSPPPPARHEGGPMVARHAFPGIGPVGHRLADLSPEGRAILREAMRDARDPETRAAIEAARARVLQIIAAERLDVRALERAMAEERDAVRRQQERQQARFLATIQRMSAADRKVLADAGLKARERFEQRRTVVIERMRERRRDGPPPAPPAPPER